MAKLETKILTNNFISEYWFISIFLMKVFSTGSGWWEVIFGFDIGSATNMWQTFFEPMAAQFRQAYMRPWAEIIKVPI